MENNDINKLQLERLRIKLEWDKLYKKKQIWQEPEEREKKQLIREADNDE